MTLAKRSTWQDVSREKKEYRDRTIAEVQPAVPDPSPELPSNVTSIPRELLSTSEVGITEKTPEALLAALAKGKLKCAEVTNAFLRRAGLAQKLVNCVTELLPQRALARAKELDEYYAIHKKPIGPLHGLPISVKEHVCMKGLDCNAAFVGWVGRVADSDAYILQILWNAGCVFYVRTTEPQGLMMLETVSNLYGTTINPYNSSLTPGGSSGGEAALLALRGSCLSVSTDIGGSIRAPAANCGNYGLRPTTHRLPLFGLSAPGMGNEGIYPVVGPQSTTLEGIKIFMKTILATQPWKDDPMLVPLPWRDGESWLRPTDSDGVKKLKIGVMWSDEVVKPQPPVIRALNEVVDKLRTTPGVEVVDWKPWRHEYGWELISKVYLPDGGKDYQDALDLSGEPWLPLTQHIVKDNAHMKVQNVQDVWHWTIQREIYRAGYNQLWNQTHCDVLLTPAGPGPAPKINTSTYWPYTSQWNLLDYPALVFPVTKVSLEKDVRDAEYTPLNEKDRDNWERWDVKEWEDAPVCLQLVGRKYEDEKIVEAMEYIQKECGVPFV